MRSSSIIEIEIATDRGARGADAVIGPEINFPVFDAAPKPLDEHVGAPRALAVHADGDSIPGERADQGLAGELRALIRNEYLRLAVLGQSLLQRLDAEIGLDRDRRAMQRNAPGETVDDRREIDKAARSGCS